MRKLFLLITTGTLAVVATSSTAIYVNQHREGLEFEPMPVLDSELFDSPRRLEKYQDSAVLEAVLLDLLTQPDSPVELGPKEKPQIHFSMEPLVFGPDIERMRQVLNNAANDKEVIDNYHVRVVEESLHHLAYRLKARDYFAKFTPLDSRVKVESIQNEKKVNLIGSPFQVFSAYPPGYSETGNEAVVKVHFMWAGNYHWAEASYFLRRVQGYWIVDTRRIFLGM